MKWEMIQMIEVFDFIRNGISIKQNDACSGIPITRIETIWNRTIDKNKFGYADISEKAYEKYSDYLLKDSDILMSHINSVKHLGKCALYQGLPKLLIHGMNLLCFRPKQNILFPKYIYYFFQTKQFRSNILNISNQSVNQASFSAGKLKEIKIPLPPLDVQKKIAAILDAADEVRQKSRALINKYNELAQSLFLDMFGDPVVNNKKWNEVNFKKVIVLKRGYDLPVQDRIEGKIPILGSNGILGYHNTPKVKGPGVVTGRSGTLGKVIRVDNDYWPLNTSLYSVDLVDNNYIYLEYFLQNFKLERFERGVGVPTLNRNLVHELDSMLPPIELQNQFADRIEAIEKQKKQAEVNLQKSDDLFNSLLPLYVSIVEASKNTEDFNYEVQFGI
jgi:type I restriction enzyme S subunit